MEKVILVRHGETDKNTQGKMHSAGDAEPISPIGIDQIKKTAERLREFNPVKVYSSKEIRAVQSGELLAEAITIPFETIEGLQERNWGDFSGKSWEEVRKVLDPMNLEERYKYIPPNGESWEVFENRLISSIESLLQKHKDENIIIVTHGGAIRALMPHLLNTPKEESFRYNPDNASITVFDYDNGKYLEVLVNDTGHLK